MWLDHSAFHLLRQPQTEVKTSPRQSGTQKYLRSATLWTGPRWNMQRNPGAVCRPSAGHESITKYHISTTWEGSSAWDSFATTLHGLCMVDQCKPLLLAGPDYAGPFFFKFPPTCLNSAMYDLFSHLFTHDKYRCNRTLKAWGTIRSNSAAVTALTLAWLVCPCVLDDWELPFHFHYKKCNNLRLVWTVSGPCTLDA